MLSVPLISNPISMCDQTGYAQITQSRDRTEVLQFASARVAGRLGHRGNRVEILDETPELLLSLGLRQYTAGREELTSHEYSVGLLYRSA